MFGQRGTMNAVPMGGRRGSLMNLAARSYFVGEACQVEANEAWEGGATGAPTTIWRLRRGIDFSRGRQLAASMAVVGKRLHALLVRAVRRVEGACFYEKWFIAVRRRSERDVLAGDMSGFIPLVAPRGRFFADPFLIEWRGRHYVFFEDYTLAWRRGGSLTVSSGQTAARSK